MPTLRPFQVSGASFLASAHHAILADCMGLGKTPQSLSAIGTLGLPASARVLIVAPLATAVGWQREAAAWLPAGFPPVTILRRKDPTPAPGVGGVFFVPWTDLSHRIASLTAEGQAWGVVIADEAHRAKTSTSAQSKAFVGHSKKVDGVWVRTKGLADVAARVWQMTGTPLPNGRPIELLPLLLAAGIVGYGAKMLKAEYLNRFCKQRNKWTPSGFDFNGCNDLPGLNAFLAASGKFLRREPGDVAGELPRMVRTTTPLVCKAPTLDSATEQQALQALALGHYPAFDQYSAYRAALGEAKVKAAAAWVEESLEDIGPMVVFVHHLSVGQAIRAELMKTVGTDIEFASGEDAPAERQAKVDRFSREGGPSVLIASMAACGTGMNGMQLRTSTCVFAELPFESATLAQAEGRIRRMRPDGTQVDLAHAHLLVASAPIDIALAEMLREKSDRIEQTLGSGVAEQSATAVAPTPPAPVVSAPRRGIPVDLVGEVDRDGPCTPERVEISADVDPAALSWTWAKSQATGQWVIRCPIAIDETWTAWRGRVVTVTNKAGASKRVSLVGLLQDLKTASIWAFEDSHLDRPRKDREYLAKRAASRGIHAAPAPLAAADMAEAEWSHRAATQLTDCDADRATVRNMSGWNSSDGTIGRTLSSLHHTEWDTTTLALAREMLPKYHAQIGKWTPPGATGVGV